MLVVAKIMRFGGNCLVQHQNTFLTSVSLKDSDKRQLDLYMRRHSDTCKTKSGRERENVTQASECTAL